MDDPTQRAATERAAQVNRLIDDEPPGPRSSSGAAGRLDRLCTALTRTLPATGVGVSLLTADHNGGGIVAASDGRSRVLEELQFTAGEGPCIDAYATGRPVLMPDLDDALAPRLEVYQAQGMVMVDLGVGVDEAMARLRAHAYAVERPIADIARDIVAGNLILERDST